MSDPAAFVFVTASPRPPLDSSVERLWYAEGRVTYGAEHILPNARGVLIANLGDPFEVGPAARPLERTIRSGTWVIGLQSESLLSCPAAPALAL